MGSGRGTLRQNEDWAEAVDAPLTSSQIYFYTQVSAYYKPLFSDQGLFSLLQNT